MKPLKLTPAQVRLLARVEPRKAYCEEDWVESKQPFQALTKKGLFTVVGEGRINPGDGPTFHAKHPVIWYCLTARGIAQK